tara:strand:+ start:1641 stop:3350 length:1710 start_codon:yes stop_codon:yes gene_type:complete
MNIDALVESFYSKEDETEQIINEVLQFLLTEKKSKNITLSWDGIPDIPISEIPWSSVETVEGEGADIQGPERQQLMQFLDNIEGDDLQDKVKGLAAFYDADPSALLDKTKDMSAKEKISAALGYLTFFKTLTKIIAHFNASSAGFSFESFLGVLLGGKQIPASGANTIADLVDRQGVPISLKLYTEGQLKVGGSFTDLVNDLRKYGKMQYVAVTKTLNDEKTAGKLDFYRFDFTLDNIAQILSRAGLENPYLIRLPAGFVDNPEAFEDIEIPEPPKPEELLKIYEDRVQELGAGSGLPADVLQNALDAIGLPEDTRYLVGQKKIFGRSKLGKISTSMNPLTRSNRSFAQQIGLLSDEDIADFGHPGKWKSQAKHAKRARAEWLAKHGAKIELALKIYYDIVQEAYNDVVEETNRNIKARAELRQRAGGEYLSSGESLAAYNNLASPALKKKALLLSAGFTYTEQFDLTQPRVVRIEYLAAPYQTLPDGQDDVKLGTIEVGQDKVVGLMEKVSKIIDESVFLIFEDLKILTTNIESYFGTGLKDDVQATRAIEASESIGERTKELKDDEK